jgi:transposase
MAKNFLQLSSVQLRMGFRKYDVLILDNAAINKECVERWLWENYAVFVLFLPTRSPEWNPIELVWRHLDTQLRSYPIAVARSKYGNNENDLPGKIARDILQEFTFDQMKACFKKCFNFLTESLKSIK